MSCDCLQCKRDNILNGTSTADCSVCSTKLDGNGKFQIMSDKTLVCDACVDLHYILCPSCSKLHKKGCEKIVIRVSDGVNQTIKVCERCYTSNYRECKDCHGIFHRGDVMGHGDGTYCRSCFSKSYTQCGHCNTVHPMGEVSHKIRNNSMTVCDKCYNFFGPIETYETKPILNFHGVPPHYYGVELECELVNANKEERGLKAIEVSNLFPKDFLILKEDGSIKCGFEMCSQPASLPAHKNIWNPFFDKLPLNLHSFNTSNCGLHIHCSKKPLSLLTVAKVVVFVNEPMNQSFVELIAGRKSNTYSVYQKKEHGMVRQQQRGSGRSDRYEAVNLLNKDTIEFRIFKGTLKRESFFKALEFCDALIRFCMTGAHGIAYCRDKQNFINFVTMRQKDYPHLYAFICAKIFKKETKNTKAFGFSVEGLSTTEQTPQQTTLQQTELTIS